MDQVFQKTQELAEALTQSEAYRNMKEAEESFRKSGEVLRLIQVIDEKNAGIRKMMEIPNPDPMALKLLSESLDGVQQELEATKEAAELHAAQAAFRQLLMQVNQVLQFILNGETGETGCSGHCADCAGCH